MERIRAAAPVPRRSSRAAHELRIESTVVDSANGMKMLPSGLALMVPRGMLSPEKFDARIAYRIERTMYRTERGYYHG